MVDLVFVQRVVFEVVQRVVFVVVQMVVDFVVHEVEWWLLVQVVVVVVRQEHVPEVGLVGDWGLEGSESDERT